MKRMLLALLAVAAAATAVGVAAPLLSTEQRVLPGPDALVNPPKPIDANNSPTLLRNPQLPSGLVVTHRVDRPGFSAAVNWSVDGGGTWNATALPLPPGLDRPFAPDAAFAPDGTLYVSYVNLEGNGNVPGNVWITTSKDGGRTLAPPVRVAGRLAFQVRTVVDPAGRVHLTWLQASEVGYLKLVGGPNPIVATWSDDGARSFSPPVVVSDPGRERVAGATPVVDSRGELVVLYQDYRDDRRDFEFLEGPPWDKPFALVVTRSRDGGRTFSSGVEVDTQLMPSRRFLVFLVEFPSLAAGPDGSLYAAWADARAGDEDVYVRRSSDGGATWAPPVRVNDNRRGDGTSQYLPKVAVAPDGRVDVVFLDRRRDPENVRTDAYLASSSDGGRTFDNVRLSSRSFDSRVGPVIDLQIGVDFGSRLGLVSTETGAVAAWADSRLGDDVTGRQDIAAGAVQVVDSRPGGGRLVVVLVLLGLAGAGLLGWLATGRPGSTPAGQADGGSAAAPEAAGDGAQDQGGAGDAPAPTRPPVPR